MNKIKILLSVSTVLFAGVASVSAQSTGIVLYGSPSNYGNNGYYNGYYDNNYNYGYDNGYNNGYYNSDSNYYNGYQYYSTPVSVVSTYNPSYYPYYNYDYNYSNNYYNYNQASITTNTATNISSTYATINAYITFTQSSYNGATTAWFEYGANGSLNQRSNSTNIYSSTSINANLNNLSCNTIYSYRPVISGVNGVQYGNTMTFTTSPCVNYNYSYNNNLPYYYQANYGYTNNRPNCLKGRAVTY